MYTLLLVAFLLWSQWRSSRMFRAAMMYYLFSGRIILATYFFSLPICIFCCLFTNCLLCSHKIPIRCQWSRKGAANWSEIRLYVQQIRTFKSYTVIGSIQYSILDPHYLLLLLPMQQNCCCVLHSKCMLGD